MTTCTPYKSNDELKMLQQFGMISENLLKSNILEILVIVRLGMAVREK